MTWLGGRMKWPFSGGAAVVELEQELDVEAIEEDGKPHMIMLAADASGLASFKLYTFSDSDGAVEFIQRSFGGRSDTGLIAFWAMTEQPAVQDVGITIEAMVLIRDDIRPEVVYPFSFLDIATAQSFVQYEMKRGLDPNNVLLYWAVPVQLGVTSAGELGLFPATPPTRSDGKTFAMSVAAEPMVSDEPPAAVVQAGELLDSLSVRVLFDGPLVSSDDDPIEALFQGTDEDASNETVVEAVAEEPIVEEDEIVEFAGGGDETHTEEQNPETAVNVADVVEPFEDVTSQEVEHTGGELSTGDEPEVETGTEVSGDEEKELEAMEVTATTVVTLNKNEPVVTFATSVTSRRTERDEVRKVLTVRRWEEHTEPFQGFQSPPGRF